MWFIYPQGCTHPGTLGLNCFQNQAIFYKNDEVIGHLNFANLPCGYCFSDTGNGTNSIPKNNYSVFVQKDKVEILFDSDANVDISLYNLNGILHYKRSLHSQNIVIPTTELSKGVYILRVFDKNTNKLYTNKIIYN